MYESFLKHVEEHGIRYTTIERKNNDGNYSKKNCVWATRAAQNRNRRNCRMITFNGQTKIIKDWAAELKMDYRTIAARLDILGWSLEKALTLLSDGRAGRYIPNRRSAKKSLGK